MERERVKTRVTNEVILNLPNFFLEEENIETNKKDISVS